MIKEPLSTIYQKDLDLSIATIHKPGTSSPYFTKSEVDGFISQLLAEMDFDRESTLDDLSNTIAGE